MINKPSQKMMRGLSDAGEKEAVRAAFVTAEPFREAAVKFLQKKWNQLQKDQSSKLNYELPAYSEMQADCNGSLRTIEEILNEVFNLKGEDNV